MWSVAIAGLAAASANGGFDAVSRQLNEQIRREDDCGCDGCIFCGGKGILVRSPLDGFEKDFSKVVVPATFWVNDLWVPTSLYPGQGSNANPLCPYGDDSDCPSDPATGDDGPWNYAQLAVVIGTEMHQLMNEYDDIQKPDWGWGVFYPTDSNAVDHRCRFVDSDNSYDCPNGRIDINSGKWSDSSNLGSGGYAAGNPYAGGGGGGTGCHFDGQSQIDQNDALKESGESLTGDSHCQCNYDIQTGVGGGSWDIWVDTFMKTFSGPMYSLDYAACWMNNPRDMIKLQNAIYWKRTEWTDPDSSPLSDLGHGTDGSRDGDRRYWGWNEVPVDRFLVNDPKNWDAIMIKLPAAMQGYGDMDSLSTLDAGHAVALESALKVYISNGFLLPGFDNIMSRPGSYVVVVREIADDNANFQRQFFCEDWTSPNNFVQLVFASVQDGCYTDWVSGAQAMQMSV